MDRYLISSSNNAFALSALTNISKQRIRTSACCLHATDIGISFPASNQAQECINSVSMRVFSVLSLFLLYHTSSLSSLLSLHRIHTNTTTQLTCLARHVSFSLPSFSPSFFVDDLQVFPSSADVCTKHRTGGQIFLVVCPSQPDNLELLHKTFQISSPAHHQDTEGCLCWLAGPCPGASFCRPCRTKRSPLQTCKTKKSDGTLCGNKSFGASYCPTCWSHANETIECRIERCSRKRSQTSTVCSPHYNDYQRRLDGNCNSKRSRYQRSRSRTSTFRASSR